MEKKKTTKKAKVTDGSYTAEGFTVPNPNQDIVFMRMQKVHFNQSTGKPSNKEFVYKTNVRTWNKVWHSLLTNGHTIHEVLHLPKGAIDPRETLKEIKRLKELSEN